ncbi:hypothetical protein G9A89_000982 [Geosiphon pyriformis]|nr:hypothetical protein G9A89_000982 [Geosiphon pyriformis]
MITQSSKELIPLLPVGGPSTTVSVSILRDGGRGLVFVTTVATKVPFGYGYTQYLVPSGLFQPNVAYYAVVEADFPTPPSRGVSGRISIRP